jgi:hypothetical protein
MAGAGVAPCALGPVIVAAHDPMQGAQASPAVIGDGVLRLEFDRELRSRVSHVRGANELPLTSWGASESLLLADGKRIERFALEKVKRSAAVMAKACA